MPQDAVDGSKSSSDPSAAVDFSAVLPGLKSRVIERVEELDMEIDTGTDEIAKQALEHIHTVLVLQQVDGRLRIHRQRTFAAAAAAVALLQLTELLHQPLEFGA